MMLLLAHSQPISPEAEMEALLKTKDQWDFDLHKLDGLTGGRPLAMLCASVLSDRGLLDKLNIERVRGPQTMNRTPARTLCIYPRSPARMR